MTAEQFAHLARQLENSLYVDAGMAKGDNRALDAALDRAVVQQAPTVDPGHLPIYESIWLNGQCRADIRDGGEFVVVTMRDAASWCAYRAADLVALPSVTDFKAEVTCRRCKKPYTMNADHVVTRPCACGRHFDGMVIPRPEPHLLRVVK